MLCKAVFHKFTHTHTKWYKARLVQVTEARGRSATFQKSPSAVDYLREWTPPPAPYREHGKNPFSKFYRYLGVPRP